MARSMLVRAHLPIEFFHLAMDYAVLILRVLPAKGLVDEDNNPTTTYQILHGKRPRVQRFKVFGCPVVFKRYQPQHEGDVSTNFKQLQRGSRGIFVGFPKNQAGWLIFVHEKINGSHLVVSSDVDFDQQFFSGVTGNNKVFHAGQNESNIGKIGGRQAQFSESTGDVTNLIDSSITHWGKHHTFENEHRVNRYYPLQQEDENDSHDSDEDNHCPSSSEDGNSESDDEINHGEISDENVMQQGGTQIIDGIRRSSRVNNESSFSLNEDLKHEQMYLAFQEIEHVFQLIDDAAAALDIPIGPYLPEPKRIDDFSVMPIDIKEAWIKSIQKEVKFIIENETFKRGEEPIIGDEIIPAMLIFKAKVTSRGYLDKLKTRCVARGDLQQKSEDPDNLWSPCVFARTFKMFVAQAVKRLKIIKQLDFIGAFCQGVMKDRLFIQLPKEYARFVPEYAELFEKPQLIQKSLYGTDVAAKVWNSDLTDWLTTNDKIPFAQSEVDPSLFIHRNEKSGDYLYLIIYTDDCLYFGSNDKLETLLTDEISKRFKLELQGHSHWFLGTRLYRENDGSYLLDQENYIKHVLNRYCGKDTPWGLPPMQNTPAPVDYVYSTENRPTSDEEKDLIARRFNGLSMPSAVSSLLYAALNTRCDILWITNKLAKSANNPGIKDFEALLHAFGYLRKFSDYSIKFYGNVKQSPAYEISVKHGVTPTEIIGFSDTSWQDCPDTGRSTCGFKVFVQGGLVDAQSTMPVPVALSSAEAEYMGACNLGAMVCHLRDLSYDFEYLGSSKYDHDGRTLSIPTVLLVDNQATVRMSKNYKVTSKNRHVGRRWHFVRRGVKDELFQLHWIPGEDQLADDMTKTQVSTKSQPHIDRTLIKIPEQVKGFKSNTVGNR